jgi:hypothetical protein
MLKLDILGVFRSRWENNIKADLEEIVCECVNLVWKLMYAVLPLVPLYHHDMVPK